MQYPYNDEFMVVDEISNHYVLTEAALLNYGIDLRARLTRSSTVSPENSINSILQTASDMIYQYIHSFNADNDLQDTLILQIPSLRPIIYKAMLYQAVYVLNVGNLYLSTKEDERKNAIDMLARQVLLTTVKELKVPITYTGVFNRWLIYSSGGD